MPDPPLLDQTLDGAVGQTHAAISTSGRARGACVNLTHGAGGPGAARGNCDRVGARCRCCSTPIDPNDEFRAAPSRGTAQEATGGAELSIGAVARRGRAPGSWCPVRGRRRLPSPNSGEATEAFDTPSTAGPRPAPPRAPRRPRHHWARIASGGARGVRRPRARRHDCAELDVKDEERSGRVHAADHAAGQRDGRRLLTTRPGARRASCTNAGCTWSGASSSSRIPPLGRGAATWPSGGATAAAWRDGAGSDGRIRMTGGCGSTTPTSPSRRRRPGSTRSSSTT